MKKLSTVLLLTCTVFLLNAQVVQTSQTSETASKPDQRMQWWREARFGMFIHWGVYSGPAGEWKGEPVQGYAEHLMRKCRIPIETYKKEVAGKFNPTKFDADEWARLAKETGFGYMVITSKHHD